MFWKNEKCVQCTRGGTSVLVEISSKKSAILFVHTEFWSESSERGIKHSSSDIDYRTFCKCWHLSRCSKSSSENGTQERHTNELSPYLWETRATIRREKVLATTSALWRFHRYWDFHLNSCNDGSCSICWRDWKPLYEIRFTMHHYSASHNILSSLP